MKVDKFPNGHGYDFYLSPEDHFEREILENLKSGVPDVESKLAAEAEFSTGMLKISVRRKP